MAKRARLCMLNGAFRKFIIPTDVKIWLRPLPYQRD